MEPDLREAYRQKRPSPGSAPRRDGVPDPGDEAAGLAERSLLCGACGATVTSARHAAEIDGSHRHTFFNPHGIVYEIGCFAAAPGVQDSEAPSAEFSWFPGYRWRVSACAACGAHLGWQFSSAEGAMFWGLIVDRLVES